MKLHQITEDDLSELERLAPEISDSLMAELSLRHKTQLRRIKDILSNVRWNYGPPSNVTQVLGDEQE